MHPWHDVETGREAPHVVNAVIEVPVGSKVKYELDKSSGLLRVDRVLFSSVHYPANYGFIPRTYCLDGDPLDILVLGQGPVVPLALVRARPIAVLRMIDQGEPDDKVLAVHVDDPEYSGYDRLEDLSEHRAKEIRRFFLDYKNLENKEVKVEEFLDGVTARSVITEAMELYFERKKEEN